jgi:5-methyltetrahydrofolate--homocysteine methyltransferase
VPERSDRMMLSGMQEFIFGSHIPFLNVGERCNIAGSLKFKNLIKKDDYEAAIAIAKE